MNHKSVAFFFVCYGEQHLNLPQLLFQNQIKHDGEPQEVAFDSVLSCGQQPQFSKYNMQWHAGSPRSNFWHRQLTLQTTVTQKSIGWWVPGQLMPAWVNKPDLDRPMAESILNDIRSAWEKISQLCHFPPSLMHFWYPPTNTERAGVRSP